MLIVFARSIILYIFLLIVMRLMGKKQLGELQPFEFAISLMVADLASIPMGDTNVPISYGLIPIFTLFVLHLIVTKIVKRSIKLRGTINGNPIIVINPNGIDYEMLSKLDMTTSDLLESLRSNGYFSPNEIEYAIVETNGNLSIMPKRSSANVTIGDIVDGNISTKEKSLPTTLISEGRLISENMRDITEGEVHSILARNNLSSDKVLLMTICDKDVYIQPMHSHYIELKLS